MSNNNSNLEQCFQDTGILAIRRSVERERGNSCIILLQKNDIGMLIWPADEENVIGTRWYIEIPPYDDKYRVLCLCGCHLSRGKIEQIDGFLQEVGILTALVRSSQDYPKEYQLKTRYIEAGGAEGLSLVKDWPIKVFDRDDDR